jgi:hypothetical protein
MMSEAVSSDDPRMYRIATNVAFCLTPEEASGPPRSNACESWWPSRRKTAMSIHIECPSKGEFDRDAGARILSCEDVQQATRVYSQQTKKYRTSFAPRCASHTKPMKRCNFDCLSSFNVQMAWSKDANSMFFVVGKRLRADVWCQGYSRRHDGNLGGTSE